ncbi:hypothetical protein MVEN_01470800 [Mycena venus]|uniref:Uncharacterized protein n=1 Tax=Mycena venus TaxID=2733690 RepID=A0A8H6XSC0_9AGAR|nr:hypothetical protein MVEN_01470800 [Mycena venus]
MISSLRPTTRVGALLARPQFQTFNTGGRRIPNLRFSMSTVKPIPIIVTGGTEKIGSVVVASMKPEYEVIHFTLAAEATKEIPLLLKGEVPSPSSSSLGSGNWSVFPKAILFGGAYKDEMIEDVRGAVAKTAETKRIPWLRVDSNLPHPPLGPEYGAAIVERAKAILGKLEAEGKLDVEDDSIHLF